MENIVSVKELEKKFGKTRAVDGVSFHVKKGEIFGFIGPDGAGKTTILRMLSGIMIPNSGEVSVLGLSIPEEAEGIKEHIGYMSQKFNMYPDLTVQENIDFFADVFLIDKASLKKRLEELFNMTRLAEFKDRKAEQLSGGMKQKLALICTLIHRPELLILDEPTTGVDPVSRREFWKILQEILLEGVTIIISTPYMDEAEWCNRVALVMNGKIVSCDSPNNLKQTLSTVVAEVHFEHGGSGLIEIIEKSKGIIDIQRLGNKYHVVLKDAQSYYYLKHSIKNQARINHISPSIEDVFINRIRRQ